MSQNYVIMSGLPGKMATLVAETILNKTELDFRLDDTGFAGPDQQETCIISRNNVNAKHIIKLLSPEKHKKYLDILINDVGRSYQSIIVDFSQPDAVNKNVELFCKYKIPFIMGTTGGNRGENDSKLTKVVCDSGNTAVIASNMAKPIVLIQSMFDYAAKNFPNSLKEFEMAIQESHQKGKKDTSGTAKAMVNYFNKLGVEFDLKNILKRRDPAAQLVLAGVPKAYLNGHGYHTYALQNEDGTVKLDFTHNINGRQVYADGTIDAIKFLLKKIDQGKPGCYNMIDVLKGE